MAGDWSQIAKEIRRASAIHRIGRNVAWELVSKPRPVDLSRVPPSTEALTPEYLTEILCTDHPDAQVTSIALGDASSGSADRCAFKVSYNAAGEKAGLPKHLFHKCTKSFYSRLHLERLGISKNETNFYNVIQPEINIEAPKSYHAEFEESSCRVCIILEDVTATQGATFFEVSTPFVRSDMEGILEILADVHAKFWASNRLDTEFDWLMTPAQFSKNLVEGMELKELTAIGMERAQSVVPPSIASRGEEVWSAFLKSMEISSRAPFTYIQGDPHLRNYYKTAADRIGLTDWQVTMKGAWSHDFTYAMLTSLPIEERRAWEKELLAFYLNRVKAGDGNPPEHADAWEIYRRQTLYTFVGWLVTIGFGALQPDMQPDSESLQIIKRAAVAIDDLDSLALLND